MNKIRGTHREVKFSRVVDGDTIRVFLNPEDTKDESLRILCLDTEESYAGGSKPVTPWGKKAKEYAEHFFQGVETVTIEFPGNEDWDTCMNKYRGNYGRLLVYVYKDQIDFQEVMIREGFSPYFMKYGYADFTDHHTRYMDAERKAQMEHLGVWDQIENNGSEMRNYAALSTWWKLRANVIDYFRKCKAVDDTLLDSRLDYQTIAELAAQNKTATVFTELSAIIRVGSNKALIPIGSNKQPFCLFIPDVESESGQEIVHMASTRYISSDDNHPCQSYAFVTGELTLYDNKPEIILQSAEQLTDRIGQFTQPEKHSIKIAAVLPNPEGNDFGKETFTLFNTGENIVNLDGWKITDAANHEHDLSGSIEPQHEKEFISDVSLNNNGDTLYLLSPEHQIEDTVSYSKSDVVCGQEIRFLQSEFKLSNA